MQYYTFSASKIQCKVFFKQDMQIGFDVGCGNYNRLLERVLLDALIRQICKKHNNIPRGEIIPTGILTIETIENTRRFVDIDALCKTERVAVVDWGDKSVYRNFIILLLYPEVSLSIYDLRRICRRHYSVNIALEQMFVAHTVANNKYKYITIT